jgi:hypothetical protein
VAFGGQVSSTTDAVLLYRLISFWFILVLGWLLIGEMALEVRRGRWQRSAFDAPVEAGPVAYEPGGVGVALAGAAGVPAAGEGAAT